MAAALYDGEGGTPSLAPCKIARASCKGTKRKKRKKNCNTFLPKMKRISKKKNEKKSDPFSLLLVYPLSLAMLLDSEKGTLPNLDVASKNQKKQKKKKRDHTKRLLHR